MMRAKNFPTWEDFVEQHAMFSRGDHVLCALSGGMDSMALLHMLCGARESLAITITALHFNHHLRGEESLRDENFVIDGCKNLDVNLILGGADVGGIAKEKGKGIEETARELRYAFLEESAQKLGAKAIATAHHSGDNGETMLFHLIRGTGLKGLCGIPPKRGNIVRPLLNWTKADIKAYVTENKISYVEDSSNRDLAFTRNRIRHEIMPILEEINPNLWEVLGQSSENFSKISAFLEREGETLLAQGTWEDEKFSISVEVLQQSEEAVCTQALRDLLKSFGFYQSERRHIELILRLVERKNPSAKLHLPQNILCSRRYDRLYFSRGEEEKVALEKTSLAIGESLIWGEYSISLSEEIAPEDENAYLIKPKAVTGDLVLRPRETGDEIRLIGGKRKSLKKLFIEKKIPKEKRDTIPIVADDLGLVAVLGLGVDKKFQGIEGERNLVLRFKKLGEKEG